jgi:hypothetical protein
VTRGRRQVLSLLDPLVQKYLLTGTNVRLLTQLGDGSAAFIARRQRRAAQFTCFTGTNVRLLTQLGDGSAAFVARRQRRAAQPVDRGCREEPRRRR